MSNELNLSVPTPQSKKKNGGSKLTPLLLVAVLGVSGTQLALTLKPQGTTSDKKSSSAELAPEALKDLAIKLENQQLRTEAIAAWKDYLDATAVTSQARAKVWYRIGKIHQENKAYEQALQAFYRSEAHSKLPELEQELNRRVQECLESSGRYAALDHELAGRVGVGDNTKSEGVLAEVGARKITRAELDQRIDEMVSRQLETMAAHLSEEQRNQQKQAMLKQVGNDQQKAQILNQLVLEEILYRKAREDKLTEEPAIRATLDNLTRQLLAGQVMDREINANVKVADSDLQDYYKANQATYKDPESAKIIFVEADNEEAAKAALAGLNDGKKNDAAKEMDVTKGSYVAGIGDAPQLNGAIFATEAGKCLAKPEKVKDKWYAVKVDSRKPERQKDFDEVRNEVYRALRSRKEGEVRERLINQLREKYDVVLHMSQLKKTPEGKK